jgi:hypothetical protein
MLTNASMGYSVYEKSGPVVRRVAPPIITLSWVLLRRKSARRICLDISKRWPTSVPEMEEMKRDEIRTWGRNRKYVCARPGFVFLLEGSPQFPKRICLGYHPG